MSVSKDWFCRKDVIEGMTEIKQILLDAEKKTHLTFYDSVVHIRGKGMDYKIESVSIVKTEMTRKKMTMIRELKLQRSLWDGEKKFEEKPNPAITS